MPTFQIWVKKTVIGPQGPIEIGLGGTHEVNCETHQVASERRALFLSYEQEVNQLLEQTRQGLPITRTSPPPHVPSPHGNKGAETRTSHAPGSEAQLSLPAAVASRVAEARLSESALSRETLRAKALRAAELASESTGATSSDTSAEPDSSARHSSPDDEADRGEYLETERISLERSKLFLNMLQERLAAKARASEGSDASAAPKPPPTPAPERSPMGEDPPEHLAHLLLPQEDT